ncbi:MAG: nucleotidyl transferase AbiEii/AbiGii toxin family protein [Candidatus Omnitrophica bacterium]|nr:nucleotidyl transferase AbiEii/AbiGii toxin family protein [Candidatus Omnitrophota bacterium]
MERIVYNSLQLRELFHLEFLRWFGRKVKLRFYAVKGGANLRFFFSSFRYSEDMDLDIQGVKLDVLKDTVMKILQASSFQDTFKPFGVEEVVPPDIMRAKQTETTQRFKIHLITFTGEDLFTKIEFSRRGFKGEVVVQVVSDTILRVYKLPPLLVPHYDIQSTIMQKIAALATRSVIQARDIFDLYILSSQYKPFKIKETKISGAKLTKAYENVFEISFEQFRDTVSSYLSLEDQTVYNSSSLWDEIKLKVVNFIDELRR